MNPSRFASRFRFAHSNLSLGPVIVVVITLNQSNLNGVFTTGHAFLNHSFPYCPRTTTLLKHTTLAILLLILNTGWVLPAFACVSLLIDWCQVEAAPVIYGTDRMINSFPFLATSRQALFVTSIWMAIACVCNTILLLKCLRAKRLPDISANA